jgi:hypothetical protein
MIIYKSITTTVENGTFISCDYNSFINIESKKLRLKCLLLNPCALLVLHRLQVQIQLSENINLRTSSASNINLNIESDYIECKASSGSSITIKGMALNMRLPSSGSDIDAKDLLANKVNAAGSSGATISVHPIVSLKAKASSGSNIDYNTTPKIKKDRVLEQV